MIREIELITGTLACMWIHMSGKKSLERFRKRSLMYKQKRAALVVRKFVPRI